MPASFPHGAETWRQEVSLWGTVCLGLNETCFRTMVENPQTEKCPSPHTLASLHVTMGPFGDLEDGGTCLALRVSGTCSGSGPNSYLERSNQSSSVSPRDPSDCHLGSVLCPRSRSSHPTLSACMPSLWFNPGYFPNRKTYSWICKWPRLGHWGSWGDHWGYASRASCAV